MKELLELQVYLVTLEKKLTEQAGNIQSSEKDRNAYFQQRKHYLDLKNALATSFKKGEEKGKKEIEFEIAKNLKEMEFRSKIL
ncbi:MAG: hypothetical protein SFU27_10370 [Thermonemataceae bacterium]|nr:hypothetical protein [Thermonemataceae bacterium]